MKVKQGVGEIVERNADAAELGAEKLEDGGQLGAAGVWVARAIQVGGLADLLIKAEAGRAAALGMGVDALGEHAAEEKGVIGEMRPQGIGLFGWASLQPDDEIRDVGEMGRDGFRRLRAAQLAGTREGEKHGGDIVREGALLEGDTAKDAPGEDVKVEGGGNAQAAEVINQRLVDEIVVEDEVALGLIAEEGDERNGVALGFGKDADDEGEIIGGELSAAVRVNHVPFRSIEGARVGLSVGESFLPEITRERSVGAMAGSSPVVRAPVTFPERIAWLQKQVVTHVRPYHLAVGAAIGLITVVLVALVGVLVLIATNFNLLGLIE